MQNEQWSQYVKQLNAAGALRADLLQQADRLLQREFLFDDEYAMEATHEVYAMNPIRWQETPNGDPEWLFMLKRQEYLLTLLAAFEITDDVRYQDQMKELLFDWIRENLMDESTWRTIDTGIRLLNWTAVVHNLQANGRLSEAEQAQINEAVVQEVNYLHDHYIDKYEISNWGVLITTGILTYAAYFPTVIPEDLVVWAQARLTSELRLQIDAQGMHWEQSPLYQLEVWRSTLAVVAAQSANGQAVDPLILSKMRATHKAIVQYLKPDGTLVMQGDTDQIRIDSLLQASAQILDLNAIPAGTRPVYDYLLLALAREAWPTPDNQAANGDLTRQFVGVASGNVFWRSDWTPNADYWHLYNGPLGSGHGHAALAHVDLVIGGQDVLVDPGRYTYVDGTERRFLKGAEAHNTLVIDDKPFSTPRDSWKFSYVSEAKGVSLQDFAGGTLAQAQYQDVTGVGATVTRNWLSLPELGLYLAIDLVKAPGRHRLERFWQIAPNLNVTQQDQSTLLLGARAQMRVADGRLSSAQTLYAPHYNDLSHLTRVTVADEFEDIAVVATAIADGDQLTGLTRVTPQQSGTQQAAALAFATGFRLDFADGENLLVTVEPQDTIVGNKLYEYDGTTLYGRLNVVWRQGTQVKRQERLL